MLEELQRRNYTQSTIRYYIRTVEDFARYFNCPPDRLGQRHIREYQAMLFHKRKLSAGSVTVYLAALRFFYCKTLRRAWSTSDTPYPKKDQRLPQILSKQEVEHLINAASTAFHRTLLMTLYATGARNAEVTRLKFRDFDKQRMVVHIQGAKGRKDRAVMFSSKLLEELREHWRRLRRSPKIWLFPGRNNHCGDQPIDTKTVWHACSRAARRAGLQFRLRAIELPACSVGFKASSLQSQLQCFPLLVVLGLDALARLDRSLNTSWLNRRQNAAHDSSIDS